jgi:hypothetical protein
MTGYGSDNRSYGRPAMRGDDWASGRGDENSGWMSSERANEDYYRSAPRGQHRWDDDDTSGNTFRGRPSSRMMDNDDYGTSSSRSRYDDDDTSSSSSRKNIGRRSSHRR